MSSCNPTFFWRAMLLVLDCETTVSVFRKLITLGLIFSLVYQLTGLFETLSLSNKIGLAIHYFQWSKVVWNIQPTRMSDKSCLSRFGFLASKSLFYMRRIAMCNKLDCYSFHFHFRIVLMIRSFETLNELRLYQSCFILSFIFNSLNHPKGFEILSDCDVL